MCYIVLHSYPNWLLLSRLIKTLQLRYAQFVNSCFSWQQKKNCFIPETLKEERVLNFFKGGGWVDGAGEVCGRGGEEEFMT